MNQRALWAGVGVGVLAVLGCAAKAGSGTSSGPSAGHEESPDQQDAAGPSKPGAGGAPELAGRGGRRGETDGDVGRTMGGSGSLAADDDVTPNEPSPDDAATGGGGATGSVAGPEDAGPPAAAREDGGTRPASTCSARQHLELPLDHFGTSPRESSLIRFGDHFAFVARDGDRIDVALASFDGVEDEQGFLASDFCSGGSCDYLGPSPLLMAGGGVQLVFAELGPPTDEPLVHLMNAVAWDGTASEGSSAPMFEGVYEVRTAMWDLATSADGRRVVFALGSRIGGPGFAQVGENAEVVGPVVEFDEGGGQACLDVIATQTSGAVSFVSETSSRTEVVWHLRELNAEGTLGLERDVTLPIGPALGSGGCPVVVASPDGYLAQWSGQEATLLVALGRDDAPDAPPVSHEFGGTPGTLLGVVGNALAFLHQAADRTHEIRRLTLEGAPAGPAYPLPNGLVRSSPGFPMLLDADESSFVLTYELEGARIVERVECP